MDFNWRYECLLTLDSPASCTVSVITPRRHAENRIRRTAFGRGMPDIAQPEQLLPIDICCDSSIQHAVEEWRIETFRSLQSSLRKPYIFGACLRVDTTQLIIPRHMDIEAQDCSLGPNIFLSPATLKLHRSQDHLCMHTIVTGLQHTS